MDIRFQAGGPAAWKADIALLFVCREDAPADDRPELARAGQCVPSGPGVCDGLAVEGHRLLLHSRPG
ncbi:MAG: aminopeptidase, partial [Deltaproteobacteria bacterium]|nr:aminopeptidase [Deltaproteobacteria bacterium]